MAKDNEQKNSPANLNDEQRKQLTKYVAALAAQLLRISDERDAYNNLAKTAADDLNLDPKAIKAAAKAVYSQNFQETTDAIDEVESILSITGNLSTAAGN